MKLAQALQERADINTKIEQLKQRLYACVYVQEGDVPDEDVASLLKELDESHKRLAQLIAGINKANNEIFADGKTLTELIAVRDVLHSQQSVYRRLGELAGNKANRARGTEIKMNTTVNAKEMHQRADALAKKVRELDDTLQQCDWTADVEI